MRILDRSSMDGDRYERRKTRDDRANPRIRGRHDQCRLWCADRPIPAARLCRDGVEAIPVFPATQEAARGALRLPATADGLFPAAFVALAGPLSTDEGASSGQLRPGIWASRTRYARKYGPEDVALLAELDRLHDTHSGPATKALLVRAHRRFGDARYARLAAISVSHLYNLRAGDGYRKQRRLWTRTRPTPVRIGVRKAPAPQGLPGYIRIDTVHQGDQDGLKGVYHINAVDIVTQWELVAAVERISEAYLLPVIALLLEGFPFAIRGFHSDCGSEYVNHDVAKLLEKLRVEFTKSRPRQTNDNALVECKNGAIIRKLMGYSYIPQKHAAAINHFYTEALNPYLNFHRP